METRFEKYKGVPIDVDAKGRFSTPEENVAGVPTVCLGMSAETVVELRTKIDKALKKKFERFRIWTKGRWYERSKWKLATVTSITEEGAVWILYGDKSREKLWKNDQLYLDTARNRELVKAIDTHRRDVRTWESRMDLLEKQMETWTDKPRSE